MKLSRKDRSLLTSFCLEGRNNLIQSFLVVDKSLVCECPLNNVPVILLSAFFSFNICYTPVICYMSQFFSFLEYVFLDYKTKLPPSVKHLIASLNCPSD